MTKLTKPASVQPFDHNGECTHCDEHLAHRADCPWLLELINLLATLTTERDKLRGDLLKRSNEKRQQLITLIEIRYLCDRATGIDRSKNHAREPGALGAVKALIGRYKELLDS